MTSVRSSLISRGMVLHILGAAEENAGSRIKMTSLSINNGCNMTNNSRIQQCHVLQVHN